MKPGVSGEASISPISKPPGEFPFGSSSSYSMQLPKALLSADHGGSRSGRRATSTYAALHINILLKCNLAV